MITSFEVGAVFKIIDAGSPVLRKILAEVRALNKAIKEAQASIGAAGASAATLAPALAETGALAREWKAVSSAAQGARRSIASAGNASVAAAVKAAAVPRAIAGAVGGGRGGSGGGRGGRGGRGGGDGIHVSSLGAPIPGGHAYVRGGGAAMAGAGALGYGLYKSAQLEDQVFMMNWHAGMPNNAENKKHFRDLIQSTAASTGFDYKEIAEAATDEIRLMKGADGKESGGLAILPEMLKAAATEAKLKPGTTIKTAMESLVQQAHMAQEYGVEEVKGMAPFLAFLSTTNPATMPQMVRAASYAMPTLKSALNMDPADILMQTTALARAGATNTKSGTWVRAAFEKALPPDSRLTSPKEYERRMFAMKEIGLVDEGGKSTVLKEDGKHIDVDKLKALIDQKTQDMSLVDKNNFMKKAFGELGQRGMFLLMSDSVRKQEAELKREFGAGWTAKYNSFFQDYEQASPIQKSRQTWEEMTNVLADIGGVALPPATAALRDFSEALKVLNGILPKPDGKDKSEDATTKIGAAAIKGAAIGAIAGSILPGPGTLGGAALGGLIAGGLKASQIYFGVDDLKPVDPKTVWDNPTGAPVGGMPKSVFDMPNDAKPPEGGSTFLGRLGADISHLYDAVTFKAATSGDGVATGTPNVRSGGAIEAGATGAPNVRSGGVWENGAAGVFNMPSVLPFVPQAEGALQSLNESVASTGAAASSAAPAVSGLTAAIEGLMQAVRAFSSIGAVPLHGGSVPPPPAAGGGGEKHSSIIMDGRKVGQLVTRRMADRASQPTEGSAYHDTTHSVAPSDFAWSNG